MKKYIANIGLYSIYLGVLLLVIGYFAGWTAHNFLLFLALLFIVMGIIGHVYLQKGKSRY